MASALLLVLCSFHQHVFIRCRFGCSQNVQWKFLHPSANYKVHFRSVCHASGVPSNRVHAIFTKKTLKKCRLLVMQVAAIRCSFSVRVSCPLNTMSFLDWSTYEVSRLLESFHLTQMQIMGTTKSSLKSTWHSAMVSGSDDKSMD